MRHTQDTSTMAVTHTIFLSLSSSVLEYNWLPQFELVVRVQGDSPLTLFLQWHDDSFQIFSLRHSRLSYDLGFFPFDLLFAWCAVFRQSSIAFVLMPFLMSSFVNRTLSMCSFFLVFNFLSVSLCTKNSHIRMVCCTQHLCSFHPMEFSLLMKGSIQLTDARTTPVWMLTFLLV